MALEASDRTYVLMINGAHERLNHRSTDSPQTRSLLIAVARGCPAHGLVQCQCATGRLAKMRSVQRCLDVRGARGGREEGVVEEQSSTT